MQVGGAASGPQLAGVLEVREQGHCVGGLVGADESPDRGEDQLMGRPVEVVRRQRGQASGGSRGGQEHGSEDCLLGVGVVRVGCGEVVFRVGNGCEVHDRFSFHSSAGFTGVLDWPGRALGCERASAVRIQLRQVAGQSSLRPGAPGLACQ